MFGIRFIKAQPTVHLMQFRGGRIVRQGAGQSFCYYAPTSTLVAVLLAEKRLRNGNDFNPGFGDSSSELYRLSAAGCGTEPAMAAKAPSRCVRAFCQRWVPHPA